MRAFRVWLGGGRKKKAAPQKLRKKHLSSLLALFSRRGLPQDEQQCGRARHSANRAWPQDFLLVPTPKGGVPVRMAFGCGESDRRKMKERSDGHDSSSDAPREEELLRLRHSR